MSEQNAKKINFIKNVRSEYVDDKKLDLIESIRIDQNEHDERILDKNAQNVIPKV